MLIAVRTAFNLHPAWSAGREGGLWGKGGGDNPRWKYELGIPSGRSQKTRLSSCPASWSLGRLWAWSCADSHPRLRIIHPTPSSAHLCLSLHAIHPPVSPALFTVVLALNVPFSPLPSPMIPTSLVISLAHTYLRPDRRRRIRKSRIRHLRPHLGSNRRDQREFIRPTWFAQQKASK